MSTLRRIAIVGAESTGKSWLARSLTQVLRARGEIAHGIEEHLRMWCGREARTPEPHEQRAIAQAQADAVMAADSGTVIADTTPLMTAIYSHHLFADDSLYPMALAHQRLYDLTLVTGLDLPWVADGLQRDGPHVRGPIDALVRQSLVDAGLDFRVIYGQGLARLNNALLALGMAPEDESTVQYRQSAQFALNQGRTPWSCETCSDPQCEHRLFTGLLGMTRTPSP